MYNKLIFKNKTATTIEDSMDFVVDKIASIQNFGPEDLIIGIDEALEESDNYLVLKSGLVITFNDATVSCEKIYFKTNSGTTDFQVAGYDKWDGI